MLSVRQAKKLETVNLYLDLKTMLILDVLYYILYLELKLKI